MHSIKLIIMLILAAGLLSGSDYNQIKFYKSNHKTQIVLKADAKNMNTRVSAPIMLNKGAGSQATFDVTYTGFSSQAQTAFQYAVNIWSSILTSNVSIKVEANWVGLDPNVLGSASASTFYRDYTNAPRTGTWYSVALAEKLAGFELNHADSADIKANFNSNFSNWYFGTDGNCPPGRYDFVSVVLHELCHGLGFQGSMDVASGQGSWGFGSGFPFVYDHFTEDAAGQKLLNTTVYPNPSTTLGSVLVSNNLYFDGTVANSVNGNTPVRLFSPAVWEASSSYSHLNEITYPAGNPNSLMTPSLGAAEAVHHPGNVSLGMFEDMGWSTNLVTNSTMVYPGDTDNNGIVDAMDILPVGVYFLLQGGPRPQTSFSWGAKEAIIWANNAATYADANGDGIVDEKDIIGIGVNWGLSHTTNSNGSVIDLENMDLLLSKRKNFEIIYNSLNGNNPEILEIKNLLNNIFNFEDAIVTKFTLEQNFPNPFNPATNIQFNLPEKQTINLKVINLLGQVVSNPIKNKKFDAGIHTIVYDASSLPNGIYIYTVNSEKYYQSRKMIILK